MRLDSHSRQGVGGGVVARQAEHLVPRLKQLANDR
jgi:hypothetical protein